MLHRMPQPAGGAQTAALQPASHQTGGEAIVDALLRHGIDTVFGLPGVQIYDLFDAFYLAQPKIKVIGARHEQGCGYMAFGAARSTGKPAVYAVVPGEGFLNSSAAMATALSCNAPVLCITGQVPSGFLGKGFGHLHEIPDQLGVLRRLTKWADHIHTAAEAPAKIARAFQEMSAGRPGPVALEMPWDVFGHREKITPVDPLAPLPAPELDLDAVAAAARLVAAARSPMILVGGGALDAGAEILELAELLDAPVSAIRSGRGVVSEAHDLGLSTAAACRLWDQTDLLIGIGTRLEVKWFRWPPAPQGQKLIRIDIDPAEMTRTIPDVGIVASAREGVRALIQAASAAGAGSSGRRPAILAVKTSVSREVREKLPQMSYLDAIRDVLPPDGIFVEDVCQMSFTSWLGFPIYQPRTFISPGYSGNLGSGFPTSLGVKVANPSKPVVSISGDGGFLFCSQELATAMQYGIPVVAIVFNNNSFGNVLRDQQRLHGGRLLGAQLVNPDFVKYAESFGAQAARVHSANQLRPVLEKALASGQPWLIEVPVKEGDEVNPWPYLMPKYAAVIEPND